MKLQKLIVYCFLFVCISAASQNSNDQFRIWKLTGYSGEVKLRGTYEESRLNGSPKNNTSYLSGIMQLRTKSYFVHPNFMIVDADGTYNPETRHASYYGLPNYFEKNNAEGFGVSALFFGKKKINLTTNARISNTILNVENISKIKLKNKLLGATLSYTNKILPFTTGYSQEKSEQSQLGSDRKYNKNERIFNVQTEKSFTSFDNNSLMYFHNESSSWQSDNLQPIINKGTNDFVEFRSKIQFDPVKKYTLNSFISNTDQKGSFDSKRFQITERLLILLPKEFEFLMNYNYQSSQFISQKVQNQSINPSLSHRLYKSLQTNLFFEYNQTKQIGYNEQKNKAGLNLNYNKQIPYGKLSLSYTYSKSYQKLKTDPTKIDIFHEEYILSSNQMVLLKKPYVDINSVVVKDITGTIVYQLNLDYILIDKNPYLEIVRIPTGLIANNSSVYIDYTATQPGLYKYSINNNLFSADVFLFKDKLHAYYRVSKQSFDKPKNYIESLVFDYYTRHVLGGQFELKFVKTGVEYEDLRSTILPYKSMRIFVNLQKTYKRLFFTFYGNVQSTQMINEGTKRLGIDLNSKIAYTIYKNIQFDFGLTYLKQQGGGVNLNVTTSKLEIRSDFRRLFVIIGADLYLLDASNSNIDVRGIYIQLNRSF